jgi:ABC-2 type transport system permease protein
VKQLPVFLQPISYCLPLTYGADMLNGAIMRSGSLNVWLDFAIMLLFGGLLYYISQTSIRRKWIL